MILSALSALAVRHSIICVPVNHTASIHLKTAVNDQKLGRMASRYFLQ